MRTLFATQFCTLPIPQQKDKILFNRKVPLDSVLRCEILVLVEDFSYLRKLIALTGKMTTDFPWLGLQQLSLVRAMTTDFPW